ncbi:hypothetical protein FQN54_006585 [Arachnomyces sp. PD_36]|nr:hypothetical protein FQN54_006585 [Arachnomyces sp. PD_36]
MASPKPPDTATEDTPQPPQTSNPRRLLILSTAHHSSAIIPPFLHTLTGTPVTSLPPAQPAHSSDPTNTTRPKDTDTETEIDLSTPIPAPTSSFAGYTTHSPLPLQTKYYKADIPIWVDEVPYTHPSSTTTSSTAPTAPSTPSNPTHPSTWKTEFLTPEARVVRDAIGAIIVCLPTRNRNRDPGTDVDAEAESLKEIVEAVGGVRDLIEEERGGVGDVPGLVVLVGKREEERVKRGGGGEEGEGEGGEGRKGEGEVGWWEESLLEVGVFGWEVVVWDPREKGEEVRGRRNQFGELEGLERVKEVLEANEWASADDDEDVELDAARMGLLSDIDEGDEGFNLEVGELEREMLGLKMAIEKGGGDGDGESDGERDEEKQVEELEGLMLKMQAVKDQGAEMPEAERRKFAIRAVRDILKDI